MTKYQLGLSEPMIDLKDPIDRFDKQVKYWYSNPEYRDRVEAAMLKDLREAKEEFLEQNPKFKRYD